MAEKIRYKDLSGSLKFAIVMAYILGITNILYFLVGFIIGMVEQL